MARKDQLRKQRTNTIINVTSKKQESDIIQALGRVVVSLQQEFGTRVSLVHEKQWYLKDIIADLRRAYPDMDFHHHFDTSSMSPDGGILYIEGHGDNLIYPILISEVKNQGTNDLRTKEGLPKQAKGNAVERLGKNLIGLRVALMKESIFPFVCFGYGCDFEQGSSILDRISTMAMFGRLNTTYLHNDENGKFNRGSFYFQENRWSVDEMFAIMRDIAERSILYYFSKYREENFARPTTEE